MKENQDIEYKAIWRDECLQWICGFANAQGGTVYIGINDDGDIVGLGNPDQLLRDIPNKIVSVLGISAIVRLHENAASQYLEINVEPQEFPVSCKGVYYIRVGATNQLLKGVALDTFLLRKQGRTWDAVPALGIKAKDLSQEALDFFVSKARGKDRIPSDVESENIEDLLGRLRLIQDGHLVNAAVLLFHPNPDVVYPGSFVKIGFFEGSEVIYQDEIGGPVIEQVDRVFDLLYRMYLRAVISYDGAHRIERYPFPKAAVREALVNAIVHKNYASTSPIQIRVYDDRLRIGNACILPEGWGLDDLLGFHESDPHNPKVAHVFFLAGFVESWGRGVQKIFTECKLDGIEPPEYRFAGSSLLIEFTTSEDRVAKFVNHTTEGSASLSTDTRVSKVPSGNTETLAEVGRSWPKCGTSFLNKNARFWNIWPNTVRLVPLTYRKVCRFRPDRFNGQQSAL